MGTSCKTKLLRPRICLILLPPCKTSHNLTRTFPPSSIRMSWMDSWSRPKKHSATPPPLYLTVGSSVPYCHSCGRVISERIEETNEMKEKRREGQRIAEEREIVRKAARRGCAFGFVADGGTEEKGKKSERRMCEAVMKGAV